MEWLAKDIWTGSNEKVDAMVELTLPEKSDIYTSQYRLYLPDKKLLQKK